MQTVEPRFVSISEVVAFVERTVAHGAPVRIAISRASKKYGVQPDFIKAFYQGRGA